MSELQAHLKKKEEAHESLCVRCGACCGAYDDPCVQLKKDDSGAYFCDIYAQRLGTRRTISGNKFECVPIAEVMRHTYTREQRCGYTR